MLHRFFHLPRVVTAFLLLWTAACVSIYAENAGRETVNLNPGWRFIRGDSPDSFGQLDYARARGCLLPSGNEFKRPGDLPAPPIPLDNLVDNITFAQRNFDDSSWRQLDLPHDWAIEGPFDQGLPSATAKLPVTGVGWYRRVIEFTAEDKGKAIYLDFGGAMARTMVWCNGTFAGGWPYGYASFRVDLTDYIKPGAKNLIAVRLDNLPESSRGYTGAGIYRPVTLVKQSPVHIGHWGVYITTPTVKPEAATVHFEVKLEQTGNDQPVLGTRIYELDYNGTRAVAEVTSADHFFPHRDKPFTQFLDVSMNNPKLWSPDHPSLYQAVTTVSLNGKVVDTEVTTFGIREIKFDPKQGLLINGLLTKIQGTAQHPDLGALGTAWNARAAQRQLQLFKEMGGNAIRTTHNPPASELLDLCDRLGILVIDEAFDCWRQGKRKNDYHLLYYDWFDKDLRALVSRDRNHPSVMLWSIGNSPLEQLREEGPMMAKEMSDIVHELDSTRPTLVAVSDPGAAYNGFLAGADVSGLNYLIGDYAKFIATYPNQPVVATESARIVSSRGVYTFPLKENETNGTVDFQVSSYDLAKMPWGDLPDEVFRALDKNPTMAGEFVWAAQDYLGEPVPFDDDAKTMPNYSDPAAQSRAAQELKETRKVTVPSRSSYYGCLDLAGFKKDRFYLYQSRWRPDLPMAHLLPHWTWPERVGQITPVMVYTSGDEGELFLNGTSLGRKKKGPFEYRLRWDDVKYAPGELRVVTYKNGIPWAEDRQVTAGEPAALKIVADRPKISADGQDLSFLTVSVVDAKGNPVPRANDLIKFNVTGSAEVVATDNGDATLQESFQSREIKAFNGLALVVVRARSGNAGPFTVRASAEGLQSALTSLESVTSR